MEQEHWVDHRKNANLTMTATRAGNELKEHLYAHFSNVNAAFLKFDKRRTGYISKNECKFTAVRVCVCVSSWGLGGGQRVCVYVSLSLPVRARQPLVSNITYTLLVELSPPFLPHASA